MADELAEPKLTANELKALKAWRKCSEDFDVINFKEVAARSRLERRLIRRTVRALARKGFTKYYRGLWTEDGEPAGSGYGLTKLGWHHLNREHNQRVQRILKTLNLPSPAPQEQVKV